ncbi:hypothetical protein [Methyloprofundus sedimenti]|nr:hypothetical protein [Methyloprofundus sedimenti]
MLFAVPFTSFHDQCLFGVFDNADVVQAIKLIDQLIRNTLAAG